MKNWTCGIGTLIICSMLIGCGHEHVWTEANYQQPSMCDVCGESTGEPLQADFDKLGLICDAQLNTPYDYVSTCNNDSSYTTTGELIFTDYAVLESDETHEALDGYEWRTVTLSYTFGDDNARNYGATTADWDADYNNIKCTVDTWDGTNFTINYNGIDYPECTSTFEVVQNWEWSEEGVLTKTECYSTRVPKGYDGMVIAAFNNQLLDNYVNGETYLNNIIDDNSILFRLDDTH